jgi:hypothetical protein
VYFPQQYSLSPSNVGNPITLLNIYVDYVDVTINATLVIVDNKTLVIKGAISSASYISSVTFTISNIMNPSPAKTSDTFVVTIGNDKSSLGGSANSVISLSTDVFKSCQANFSPAYTNTTGKMILTISPKNPIPMNGSVIIGFPTNLLWSEDVSSINTLPLDKVTNCTTNSS